MAPIDQIIQNYRVKYNQICPILAELIVSELDYNHWWREYSDDISMSEISNYDVNHMAIWSNTSQPRAFWSKVYDTERKSELNQAKVRELFSEFNIPYINNTQYDVWLT